MNPTYILSVAFAGSVGYMLCEMLISLPHGLFEGIAMVGLFLLSNLFMTGKSGIEVLLVGYGFAWVGHFFFELNQPATFIYPTYSLMGDFNMLYDVVTGRLSVGVYGL